MVSDLSNMSKEQQNYWSSQTCTDSVRPIFWLMTTIKLHFNRL